MPEAYKYRTQHLRGTTSEWAQWGDQMVPLEGEIVIEIDEINSLHKLKIGDGQHKYSELTYLTAGGEYVTQVLPRIVTVELKADQWLYDEVEKNSYYQDVHISGVTTKSRLDIQPTINQINIFKSLGLSFTTENHNTVDNNNENIRVYSGDKVPLETYIIQATIVETDIEDENEVVVGIPVIVPELLSLKTPEGGIIFGDYESNHALAPNSAAFGTITRGDYQPAGTVAVALSGAEFNKITSVGTAAQFTEGVFTPATLEKEDVTANYAKEGIVGTVEGETLTFTAAGIEALTATKVNGFTGGSKAADTWVANTPATMEVHNVGVQSATFTGEVAAELKVNNVSYQKHDTATATFTGEASDISATFAGTEGDVAVAGKYTDTTYAAEATTGAIELAVGDIAVAAKEVTVR